MAARTGLCANFGNCAIADSKRVIEIAAGQDFLCPGCGKTLLPYTPRKTTTGILMITGAIFVTAAIAAGGWFLYERSQRQEELSIQEQEAQLRRQQSELARQQKDEQLPQQTKDLPSTKLPPCSANDSDRRRLKLCE